jgi:hypothetical protein
MDRVRGTVEPVTALGVLFDRDVMSAGGRPADGRADAATHELERAVSRRGDGRAALREWRSLGAGALALVDEQVSLTATSLLDVDLGEVLGAGWTRYAALRDAGRRSLADPATDEVVPLHTHRVTSTREPRVELLVDGRRVHSFDFRLELALEVVGVSAAVSAGRLVAIRGGSCTGELSLYLADELLAQRKRTWDPALLVHLDPPLPLASDEGTWPE